jgi:hypothetical protein
MTEPVIEPAATPAATPAAPATPAPAATPATPATAPATPAAASPAPTIATGSTTEPPVATPADWPADWRDKFAGGDDKVKNRLERFASPNDVWKAMRALEQRQGELKAPLPKDATPEQLTQWRKDNGIPETHDKYDLSLPNGLVIGEQDKPVVDEYLKTAHAMNMPPEVVKSNLEWYFKTVEAQNAATAEADKAFKAESEEKLRAEWGADFKANVNLVAALTESAPEGVKDRLMGGYTADGKKIGDDPAVLKWLANLSREINPAGTVVPPGPNAATSISEEIATLNKLMGDKSSEYWTGPKVAGTQETKMQVRYRELVTAQEKMKGRAA